VKPALNVAIGDRWLCAWQVAPGVVWVQTRSPQFARKLSQRGDSQLRAVGVAGGYLRTFEFPHGLAWARRLIDRYTANETPTNAVIKSPAEAESAAVGARGMMNAMKTADHATPTNARIIAPIRPVSEPELAAR